MTRDELLDRATEATDQAREVVESREGCDDFEVVRARVLLDVADRYTRIATVAAGWG